MVLVKLFVAGVLFLSSVRKTHAINSVRVNVPKFNIEVDKNGTKRSPYSRGKLAFT